MIRTTMLSLAAVAVALAGLVAGCKSTDEPTPVPPPEQPEKAQTSPEPVEKPGPLDLASAAWAVSRAPADAALVLAIASPAALEKDLKALLGPDVADEMNLVDAMEKELPPGAIDATGPVVLILPASGEEAQPVTYYRIKDASVIQGTSAGAGTVAVQMRPDPAGPEHTVYCLTTAPWVAVSVDQASLRAVMRAEKHLALTDARRAAIGRRSLWLYADPKPLAELASKAIEAQVKSSEAAGAPPSPPAAIKMVHSLLDLAAGLEGVDLVADVKPTGIDAQADVTIAEGSDLLGLAQAALPIETYKVGLPATDDMILAVWGRLDWAKAIPPVKTLFKPFLDLMAEGEDEKVKQSLDRLWASYEKWGPVLGDRFGMVMTTAPTGKGLYRLAETFTVAKPDEYRKLLKEQMATSADLMQVMMGKMGAMPGMPNTPPAKTTVTFDEAAETIEGVPVDVWTMTFEVQPPPDAPPEAAEQVKQFTAAMYGPEGMRFRMGVVDTLGVVALGDKDLMAAAIKTAQGKSDDLADHAKVAAALKRAPQGASAVGLISLGHYMYMAMSLVDQMVATQASPEILEGAKADGAGPVAPPAPGDLVSIASLLDGRTLRFTVNVPQSELRNAVSVTTQAQKRMTYLMKKSQEAAQEKQQKKATPAPAPGAAQ